MHLKRVESKTVKNFSFCGKSFSQEELTTDIEKVTCDKCKKMLNFGPFVGEKIHGLYTVRGEINRLISKLEYFFGEKKEKE